MQKIFTDDFFQALNSIISLLSYLTAAISLAITAYSARISSKANNATYWLELRKMFSDYNEIHKNLQINEEWRRSDITVSKEDVIAIVGYMGLFEHCYDMIKNGLIDRKIFRDIYSYRLHVLMDSPKIVNSTLVNSGRYWENFRLLAGEFGHSVPERHDINVQHREINYPVGWEE